jgi:hypothetical protein
VDEDNFGSLATLPVIPYTTQGEVSARQLPVDDELDSMVVTLPVVTRKDRVSARQLPVDEELVGSLITLPVTTPKKLEGRRQLPVDVSLQNGLATLTVPPPPFRPIVNKRQLPVDESDSGAFITLPVIHSTKPGVFRRAVEVKLANRSDVAYYAQLNIGTPPQPVYVQLDTGSFELWVNPDCSILTPSDKRFCEAIGFYDTTKSTTVTQLPGTRTLRYGIGAANISYVKDDISLTGSATMKQVQFGVATSSEDQFAGILGIGYGQNITTRYRNFVDELKAQGVTRTKMFSLALGSKNEQEGVLVFGGIDTAKFGGSLAKLPIIPADKSPDGVARYWVQMNNLTLTPPSGRKKMYANTSMAVFLDSGATLTLLPKVLADQIASDFGATGGVDANGFYPIDCSLLRLNGTLDFAFDGITIKVPYAEMIRELRTTPPTCFLGVVPNPDFVLLGDTFLRSAYGMWLL